MASNDGTMYTQHLGDRMCFDLKKLLSPEATLVLPADAENFEKATERYSECGSPTIALAVHPATEEDAKAVVLYTREWGHPLLIRNTGHGGSVDLKYTAHNTVQLSVSSFKKLQVNTEASTMTVGAGTVLKDVVEAAHAAGKQITVGSCDGVGLLGASLGGGLGRLQGLHGLIGDNILSARVLLANGDILTASELENSDLFWALKGAGHNFGLVLEATLQLHPLIPNIYNANRVFAGSQLEAVFRVMKEHFEPPAANTSIYLSYTWSKEASQVVVFVDFVFIGPASEGRRIVGETFDSVSSLVQWEAVHPWNRLNEFGSGGLTARLWPSGGRKNSFSACLKTYNAEMMRRLFDGFVDLLQREPGFRKSIYAFESYPNAAVRAVPAESTAVAIRDVNIVVLVLLWYDDAGLDVLAEHVGRQTTMDLHRNNGFEDGKARVYLNYARGDEEPEEIYGHEGWRLQRLKALKKKYDPTGVFSAYHPIRINEIVISFPG